MSTDISFYKDFASKEPYIPSVMDLVCTSFNNDEPINQLVVDYIDDEQVYVTDIVNNTTDFYPIETTFYKLASVCQQP
jgi:hypothetical protein